MRRIISLKDRFWAKVTKTNGCWLWVAACYGNGYGLIGLGGKKDGQALAHRVSWQLHYGPIPEGKCVCHHCDVKNCVRPDHLFLGTYKENLADMTQKGRRAPMPDIKGEANGSAKLTARDIVSIREMPGTQQSIADLFGIKQPQVSRIKLGQNWAHV